jgi:hypothetical protein
MAEYRASLAKARDFAPGSKFRAPNGRFLGWQRRLFGQKLMLCGRKDELLRQKIWASSSEAKFLHRKAFG